MLALMLSIAALVFCIMILWLGSGNLRDSDNPPPIPCSATHRKVVTGWLRQANIAKVSLLEVGSGWGGHWAGITKELPIEYSGVELLWPLYALSRILHPKLHFIHSDIRNVDISPYNVVVGYMGHALNQWVIKQKRDTEVVFISVIFREEPNEKVVLIDTYQHWTGNVYYYKLLPNVPKQHTPQAT